MRGAGYICWLARVAGLGLFLLACAHTTESYEDLSSEKLLCVSLMQNYSEIGLNGRPVQNKSGAVPVQFALGLVQMDLDEKDKILMTSMWAKYRWYDHYLRWNPANFGGIQSVKIAAYQIWKPDIMLYNTAETAKEEREVLAVVSSNGWVLWGPQQIFRSSCSIDVGNYPFDKQECHMYFGSWTHSLQELNLDLAIPQGIDLSTFMADYKESCSWDIYNLTAKRKLVPANDPSFVLLAFTLHLNRKITFSTYILTLPCIFLASLTLVVFWLPPDRPDRTTLAMSIFASFLLLLLILVEAAPPTASSVPILGVYYCFNMVIIMLSIFLSTLVVNICRCQGHSKPVPLCIRKIFIDYLACLFCLNYPLPGKQESPSKEISSKHKSFSEQNVHLFSNNGTETSNRETFTGDPINHPTRLETQTRVEKELIQMRKSLQDMASAIVNNMTHEQARGEVQREWRTVALVLDRIFFVIYLLAITCSLVFLFPRPT